MSNPQGKACRPPLTFWWWGEDEAPGLAMWVDEATRTFERTHGTPVEARLLRHDEVLTRLPTTAVSGEMPDVHFLWNGIYHVDYVWKGLLRPLDDLLDEAELQIYSGGPQSTVDGLTYRLAWYVIPVLWVANCDVLARAGVEGLPFDWPSLMDSCARVQHSGLRPFTVGDGEGDFSVWWFTHFLTQALDRPSELVELVLGSRDWRETRYALPWRLLAEVRDAGFLDAEALGTTLWDGLQRFNEGESAFTLASGPMFAGVRRALGRAATVLVAPRASGGMLAGCPVVDTQGLGICTATRNPHLAAELLRMLLDSHHQQALWDRVGLFPADRRWPGPASDDPDYVTMWRWYSEGPNVSYIPNLLPLELHFDLAAGIGQGLLAGKLEAERAGEAAQRCATRWASGADVSRYERWAREAAR